jgi:hypothetical protein
MAQQTTEAGIGSGLSGLTALVVALLFASVAAGSSNAGRSLGQLNSGGGVVLGGAVGGDGGAVATGGATPTGEALGAGSSNLREQALKNTGESRLVVATLRASWSFRER